MNQTDFYETILDNMSDGVYILDDEGNYVFVNSAYVRLLNMPKSTLLQYNVHDFLRTGQIDICISDVAYKKKSQVVMLQHVYDTQRYGRQTIQQIVISTPILNREGNVQNILAIVRPLNTIKELYQQCCANETVASFMCSDSNKEDNNAIVAVSTAMKQVLSLARTVSDVDTSVLITGESGTGKEVIANYIHQTGRHRKDPFVVINCTSLPETLLEAELFGYEKGSFTGASSSGKKGLFEEAAGGIVFLDEINSLPLNLQGKLLRTIETKSIRRIGATKNIKVHFQLVSATNENLDMLVAEKRFRLDLYYRLNVIPIHLPPLRDRKEDSIPLAKYFLNMFCLKYGKQKLFSEYTLRNIMEYDWPGNVRQLKNFVERSVIISIDETIEIDNVGGITGGISPPSFVPDFATYDQVVQPMLGNDYERMLSDRVSLDAYLDHCEREYLRHIFRKNPSTYKVADFLGISQSSAMRKKKKYNL